MRELLLNILWETMQSMGMFMTDGEGPLCSTVIGRVAPIYGKWINETIRIFERHQYLQIDGDRFGILRKRSRSVDDLWSQWNSEKQKWLDNPDLRPEMSLLDLTLRALPQILSGERAATDVIFPGASLSLVEEMYKHNPMADYFNTVLANSVEFHVRRLVAANPSIQLKIIEIGAGTGATTSVVLPRLRPYHSSMADYCYTDLSKAFLNHAERSYGPDNPFLSYRHFNVEMPIRRQQMPVGDFHIAIAANVMHATRDIRTSLRNTKDLLRRDGVLFLNELTTNSLFNHLTFGLLEGWWLYEDIALRIPGSPALAPRTWREVLESEGFRHVTFPCDEAHDLGQQIIVAQSNGIMREDYLSRIDGQPALSAAGGVTKPPERQINLEADLPTTAGKPVAKEHGDEITALIVNEVASVLRIEPSDVDVLEPLASYGLDSILSVNLTRNLNKRLTLDMELTTLFEHNTVSALRKHILQQTTGDVDRSAGSRVGLLIDPSGTGTVHAPLPQKQNTASDRGNLVYDSIARILADSLRIDVQIIDPGEPFSSYGLDSILAVAITRSINHELALDLDITIMFEYNTLGSLSAYVATLGTPANARLTAEEPKLSTKEVNTIEPGPASLSEDRQNGHSPHSLEDRNPGSRPIAVIGIDGQFPGAPDILSFWKIMKNAECHITRPPLRPDWQPFKDQVTDGGELAHIWGAFLEDIHGFDPLFFDISPAEARQMSPEQRLLLMSVWNAVENGGYTPRLLAQSPTGVFIAATASEYQEIVRAGNVFSDLLRTPSLSMLPNRISFFFNLSGPSECYDTTCSSSLVALHRAIQSIQSGECAQAIVGAVNLIQSPAGFVGMRSVGMLSESGIVRPFQNSANGTARGEGVGAILIKPLDKAIADGDHIYASIRGTGVAHGGKGVSLTAPNIRGMKAAMRQAYKSAAVDPRTISYIEAHGMSTTLADSAEISALKSGLTSLTDETAAEKRSSQSPTWISTLKPCLGHSEVFSGIAALIKVVLAMRYETIPAIGGFTALNSAISLEGSWLKIAHKNIDWARSSTADEPSLPRRAGINSYGVSGVNAHVVLEEYIHNDIDEAAVGINAASTAGHVIILSAKNKERLKVRAQSLVEFLGRFPTIDLGDLAYTLQIGREAMQTRLATVVRSHAELVVNLELFIDRELSDIPRPHRLWFTDSEAKECVFRELLSGQIGDMIIGELIRLDKLEEIAKYWAAGAQISWDLLHRGARRRRVPLPGYPFSKDAGEDGRSPFVSNWKNTVSNRGDGSRIFTSEDALERVASVVGSTLGIEQKQIGLDIALARYGMNSLLTTQVAARLMKVLPGFQPEWIRPDETIQQLVARMAEFANKADIPDALRPAGAAFAELVPLNTAPLGAPIFWIHGALGSVESFQSIARQLKRPFYGIQARGFGSDDPPIEGIPAIASYYIEVITSRQPVGPYDLGGFCLGGIIAYEMARQLQERGDTVNSIVMIDSPDNTGFKESNASPSGNSFKNAALQVVNTLLWPTGEKDLACILKLLIDQRDVDDCLSDQLFVEQLASLAVKKGFQMTREQVSRFINHNVAIQLAYKLQDYVILPLPHHSSVKAYYFRNTKGVFYGDLSRCFTVASESFSLDSINYLRDWQRELKNMTIIDIEAPNHMVILSDESAVAQIRQTCDAIYSFKLESVFDDSVVPC